MVIQFPRNTLRKTIEKRNKWTCTKKLPQDTKYMIYLSSKSAVQKEGKEKQVDGENDEEKKG